MLSAKSLRPRVKKAALGASTCPHFGNTQKSGIFHKVQQNIVSTIKHYVYEDMNMQDEKDHYDSSSHKKYILQSHLCIPDKNAALSNESKQQDYYSLWPDDLVVDT